MISYDNKCLVMISYLIISAAMISYMIISSHMIYVNKQSLVITKYCLLSQRFPLNRLVLVWL